MVDERRDEILDFFRKNELLGHLLVVDVLRQIVDVHSHSKMPPEIEDRAERMNRYLDGERQSVLLVVLDLFFHLADDFRLLVPSPEERMNVDVVVSVLIFAFFVDVDHDTRRNAVSKHGVRSVTESRTTAIFRRVVAVQIVGASADREILPGDLWRARHEQSDI